MVSATQQTIGSFICHLLLQLTCLFFAVAGSWKMGPWWEIWRISPRPPPHYSRVEDSRPSWGFRNLALAFWALLLEATVQDKIQKHPANPLADNSIPLEFCSWFFQANKLPTQLIAVQSGAYSSSVLDSESENLHFSSPCMLGFRSLGARKAGNNQLRDAIQQEAVSSNLAPSSEKRISFPALEKKVWEDI